MSFRQVQMGKEDEYGGSAMHVALNPESGGEEEHSKGLTLPPLPSPTKYDEDFTHYPELVPLPKGRKPQRELVRCLSF